MHWTRACSSLCMGLLLTLAACARDLDRSPPVCPDGMIGVAGGVFVLGEWAAGGRAEFPLTEVTVAPYCMDRFAFPGVEGLAPMTDGLQFGQLEGLSELLAAWGRRPCTVSELLLGAAGPDNWRFPYDPERYAEGICPPDTDRPGPLGGYEGCESPYGFRDFTGRSAWGTVDPSTADLFPGGLNSPVATFDLHEHRWALQSGSANQGSFYASNNFGLHTHGAGEGCYWDDSFRACRSPDVAEPRPASEWSAWLNETWPSGGSWQQFLDQAEAAGLGG